MTRIDAMRRTPADIAPVGTVITIAHYSGFHEDYIGAIGIIVRPSARTPGGMVARLIRGSNGDELTAEVALRRSSDFDVDSRATAMVAAGFPASDLGRRS